MINCRVLIDFDFEFNLNIYLEQEASVKRHSDYNQCAMWSLKFKYVSLSRGIVPAGEQIQEGNPRLEWNKSETQNPPFYYELCLSWGVSRHSALSDFCQLSLLKKLFLEG